MELKILLFSINVNNQQNIETAEKTITEYLENGFKIISTSESALRDTTMPIKSLTILLQKP